MLIFAMIKTIEDSFKNINYTNDETTYNDVIKESFEEIGIKR